LVSLHFVNSHASVSNACYATEVHRFSVKTDKIAS
jgi:hypothetical protein